MRGIRWQAITRLGEQISGQLTDQVVDDYVDKVGDNSSEKHHLHAFVDEFKRKTKERNATSSWDQDATFAQVEKLLRDALLDMGEILTAGGERLRHLTKDLNDTMRDLRHEVDDLQDSVGADVEYLKDCARAIHILVAYRNWWAPNREVRDALKEIITLMPRI